MIEKAPKIKDADLLGAMIIPPDNIISSLVEKINDNYEYWDTVKYKSLDDSETGRADLWCHVKASRISKRIRVWDKYGIHLPITNRMQRMCHEFDMNFGGSWGDDSIIPKEYKERYLVSSLMEEAIYSSQMEGAATTRKVAKEMLKKKISPRDKSQQMIVNNYQTIRFVVEHKSTPLTPDLLMEVHRLMTESTLANPGDAGRFRNGSDDVVVENAISHEVVHTPPPHDDIRDFVKSLCDFFNDDKPNVFIHPIIRGIIIHFMIAYMHPFVDGNGRTARAMFYWYMLRQGYWLTEYMSISRVIARSKKAYEKAFLYTENDDMDIGYFVSYNLRVLELSFRQLQSYICKKQSEKNAANAYLSIGNINERQAQIIRLFC
ncbi:MAG: Fic family protein, partial [Muribaculaceae bacterium]|nr:Fic family protein [Muribaculaceae bacterium]